MFKQIDQYLRRTANQEAEPETTECVVFQQAKSLLTFWAEESQYGRDQVQIYLANHAKKGWGFMRYRYWYPAPGYTADGSESDFLLIQELLQELENTKEEPKLLTLMVQMPMQKIPKK